MPVKFFCDTCGKELWSQLDTSVKETTTIAEIESEGVLCSDCWLSGIFRSETTK